MPTYKLVYFNAKGRAEVARLLFAHAGVEFEDKRFERAEWPEYKPQSPTGQAPWLEIVLPDGDYKLAQSAAIVRYLAREFGLYGKDNLEAAKIDMVMDTVEDFLQISGKVMFSDSDEAKEKAKANLLEKAPAFISLLENVLKENGGKYFVGSKVSVADFYVMHYMFMFEKMPDILDLVNKPSLVEHRKRIEALPNLAKYIAQRPVTEF